MNTIMEKAMLTPTDIPLQKSHVVAMGNSRKREKKQISNYVVGYSQGRYDDVTREYNYDGTQRCNANENC